MERDIFKDFVFNAVNTKDGKPATAEKPKTTEEITAEEALKNYLKIMRLQKKQGNNLLGSFDENGNYKIVNDKIVEQLLIIPKQFDEKVESTVYMSARIAFFVLNFKIDFKIDASYCEAELSLIEIERGEDEDIKHVTSLDKITEPYSPYFQQSVYKKWNVSFENCEDVKNDYLYQYLHMQEEEFLFCRELVEMLAELYMLNILKLLVTLGPKGQKIKAEYQKIIDALKEKDPSILKNFTKLKAIMDGLLMKHNFYPVLLATKEGRELFAKFYTPLLRVTEKDKTGHLNEGVKMPKGMEHDNSKKPASKTKSAAKPSKSKSASKSKPKKSAAKPKVKKTGGKVKNASGGGGAVKPDKAYQYDGTGEITPEDLDNYEEKWFEEYKRMCPSDGEKEHPIEEPNKKEDPIEEPNKKEDLIEEPDKKEDLIEEPDKNDRDPKFEEKKGKEITH